MNREIRLSRHQVQGPGLFPIRGRQARIDLRQMNAISTGQTAEFQFRLYEHLNALPEIQKVGFTREQLWRQVENGVSRAQTYLIERECDVARYVELVCCHLGGFYDRHPRAVENTLYDRRISPAARLENLASLLASKVFTSTERIR